MRLRGRLLAAGAALAMTIGGVSATSGEAGAATRVTSPAATRETVAHSAPRAAVRFLDIADTWRAYFYNKSLSKISIGTRDTAYAAPRLDQILKGVIVGPDSDANEVTWIGRSGKVLSRRTLRDGTVAMAVRTTIVIRSGGTFTRTSHVHVRKESGGVWKVVGARLPGAFGPTKWCDDTPEATAFCDIFPRGSD